jgi:hypothetical protein
MSALSRDARTIIARGKPGDRPTQADRARVLAKLEVGWAAAPQPAARPKLAQPVSHFKGWLTSLSAIAMVSAGIWLGVRQPAEREPLPRPAEPALAPLSSAGTDPAAPEPAPLFAANPPRTESPQLLAANRPAARRPARNPAAKSRPNPAPRAEVGAPAPEAKPAGLPRELHDVTATPRDPSAPESSNAARNPAPPFAAGFAPIERGTADERQAARAVRQAPAGLALQPIEDEVALMGAAQSALARGKYTQTLQFVQQHAFRFPRGALAPERLATQTLALCALHRPNQARQVLASLKRLVVSSPLLDRVERDCGF